MGNIDKSTTEKELIEYFSRKYYSIVRIKLIKNNGTNESKGYGFIEFNDFIEFNHALNNSEPVIFGKQKLIFNSARNKYDNFNSFNNAPKILYNTNENNNFNGYNFIYSNKENINFNYNINNRPKKERNNKFEINNNIKPEINEVNEQIDLEKLTLNEQIKYSLKNIANNYSTKENFIKSKICTYYCAPFLDKNIFNMDKFKDE